MLILICALNLAPGDCDRHTARVVMQGPDINAMAAAMCGFRGQQYLAQTAIGRDLQPGEYVKFACTRTGIGKENVG